MKNIPYLICHKCKREIYYNYPNKTYSTFGIKLKLNQIQDTFSNKGNFEIHLCNINLQGLQSQSKNTIIKNTPIFCYNQHSKQTTMAKLDNGTLTIRTNMSKSIINKAKQNLINPCFVNLSFIPFRDSKEANNISSQKISLTADDIDKGSVTIENKIPDIAFDKSKSIIINQAKSNESKEIISIKFIEQLSCNIVSCKHNKDDRKTFGTKHIHIVPQLKLKGKNNSVIGKNRDGILIHYGDTGEWSTGCLLPANELRWTKEKWIAKDRDSTINAIARLYIALIQHDTEAFKIMHLVRIIWQKAQLKNLLFKLKKTIGLNPIHLRSNNAFNNLYVFYY